MSLNPTDLKFGSDGLIPAIIQDSSSGDVLMVAYMNDEAVRLTLETGFTHFFSRSRQKLWKKGESSGHVQAVRDVLYDCDADAVLVKVDQEVAACHTGHYSCFYRSMMREDGSGEAVFDPEKVYGGAEAREVLDRLYGVIVDRKNNPRKDSYTTQLLAGGTEVMGKKILEEGFELINAAEGGKGDRVISEAADLLYHLWVVLGWSEVRPQEVMEELAGRFGRSGLKEKASRREGS